MSEKLVPMEKDGELTEVHPTTVKSHEAVGWKLSEKALPLAKALKAKAEETPVAEKMPAPKKDKNAKAAEAVVPEE